MNIIFVNLVEKLNNNPDLFLIFHIYRNKAICQAYLLTPTFQITPVVESVPFCLLWESIMGEQKIHQDYRSKSRMK